MQSTSVSRPYLRQVDITMISADSSQPRKTHSPDFVDRLAKSIKEHGLLWPIRVRSSGCGGRYIIVRGEYRYRAAKIAGLRSIDCYICDGSLDRADVLEERIIIHELQEDWDPMDRAKSFKKLMDLRNWPASRMAQNLHLNPQTVAKALSLLNLAPEVQEMVATGNLTQGKAHEVAKLPDKATQLEVVEAIVNHGLPQPTVAAMVRGHSGSARVEPGPTREEYKTADGSTTLLVLSKKKLNAEGVLAVIDQARNQKLLIASAVPTPAAPLPAPARPAAVAPPPAPAPRVVPPPPVAPAPRPAAVAVAPAPQPVLSATRPAPTPPPAPPKPVPTKKDYSFTAGTVTVRSDDEISSEDIAGLLESALRTSHEEVLGLAKKYPDKITLKVLLEVLQSVANQDASLEFALAGPINKVGSIIVQAVFDLLRHDAPLVRTQAGKALNEVSAETKRAIEHLRK